MGKTVKKNRTGAYKGLKGWEVNYLKQAQKYGHLKTKTKKGKR